MNKRLCLLIAVLLAAGLQTMAARQITARGEKLLAAAEHKATIDGDLKGAIEEYRKIVEGAGADRALAAQALLRMAECYQKLGDAESGRIYERVVKEYADQPDAVSVASARLGRIRSAAGQTGIVTRQVWAGSRVNTLGAISTDGRVVPFADWSTGDLALHDLTTGKDRQLVQGHYGSREFAQESALSPDGRQLAYAWFNKSRIELRIVGVEGPASVSPRVLHAGETIESIAPHAWSPDGRRIAVQLRGKDHTVLIGLVNARDGALQTLKSVDTRGSTTLCFSPDGGFLAFDRRSNDRSDERDVFVLTVDGSREIPSVVHAGDDRVIGWTPDGRHLLFASDRGGSKGLWSLQWAKGAPQGEPSLVKSDINVEEPLGVTRGGALYYGVTLSMRDVYLADVDANTGRILSPPFRPIEQFVGGNSSPDWSPDGRSLAYVSRGTVLAIRAMDTGQTRELQPALNPLFTPRWAPDGRSLAAIGRDGNGRYGIHRIDARTGTASLIVEGRGVFYLDWLPDGKKLVYREAQPNGFTVFEYDVDSGARRELVRGGVLSLSLSPDGRYLAYVTDSFQLMLLPIAGGEPREVPIQGRQGPIGVFSWTPDSRAILYGAWTPTGDSRTLWLVSPDGSQPRRVDLNLALAVVPLRFNPHSSQIAVTANVTRRELWVMEHFLPPAKAPSAGRQDP